MDPRIRHAQIKYCPAAIREKVKIWGMAKAIGFALGTLSNKQRGLFIREIQRLENRQHSELCIQFMKLENYKMNSELYNSPENEDYYAPPTYADALLEYVNSLPMSAREQFLKKVMSIIDGIKNQGRF